MKTGIMRIGVFLILLCILISPGRAVQATNSATLSAVPSVQQVSPGSTFDVTIRLNVNFQTRGLQCALSWDPAKVQCNSVVQGGFYKDFGHNATVSLSPTSLNYNNTTGKFPKVGTYQLISLQGGDTDTEGGVTYVLGPTGEGDVFILHMAAKAGASGAVAFTLSNGIIVDNSIDSLSINPALNNGQVTISDSSSTALPTITSFSPSSGVSGTEVVITGTNFPTDLSGNSAVQFGSTNAQSYTVNSNTQITAVVPNLGAGNTSVAIRVTTPAGTATSETDFSYTATSNTAPTPSMPTISAFTPQSGGSGTAVVIIGTNFSNVTAVQFGGTNASSFVVNSATQITATVGTGSSGKIKVISQGNIVTSSGSFSFTANTSPSSSTTTSPSPTTTSSSSTVTSTPTLVESNKTTIPDTLSPTSTAISSIGSIATTSLADNNTATQMSSKPILTTIPRTTPVSRIPAQTTAAKKIDIPSDWIDSSGIMQDDYLGNIKYSGDYRISFVIKAGTRALESDGSPLSYIRVNPPASSLTPPPGDSIISASDFAPSGATFSNPITLIYEYNPANLPAGVEANNLSLVYFNLEDATWENCEYTLDTQSHRIMANISHFSVYAIVANGSPGIAGLGWNLTGTIIVGELVVSGIIVYYILMRRRRRLFPAVATAAAANDPSQSSQALVNPTVPSRRQRAAEEITEGPHRNVDVRWDDLLQETAKQNAAFKTHLEVIGGKIIIPRDGKSANIELVNMPDSHIMISLEYDPESHPQGSAKIVVLGPASEYEKSKENGK